MSWNSESIACVISISDKGIGEKLYKMKTLTMNVELINQTYLIQN